MKYILPLAALVFVASIVLADPKAESDNPVVGVVWGGSNVAPPLLFMKHDADVNGDGEVTKADVEAIGELKTRSEERRVGKECRSRWSP